MMAAVAHGWKKPGGGPSKAVAMEFNKADAAKHKKRMPLHPTRY